MCRAKLKQKMITTFPSSATSIHPPPNIQVMPHVPNYTAADPPHPTKCPWYNRALWVTSSQRGRCGEYSMLLSRMLQVLGYSNVQWVVDWADHVWAEVRLGADGSDNNSGRWVHLHPCEAAVDNPLIRELGEESDVNCCIL